MKKSSTHSTRPFAKAATGDPDKPVHPTRKKEEVGQSNDEKTISNGSAGAFEATEDPGQDEDSDEDNDDLALGHTGPGINTKY